MATRDDDLPMPRVLSRRKFLQTAAVAGGTLVLTSCGVMGASNRAATST